MASWKTGRLKAYLRGEQTLSGCLTKKNPLLIKGSNNQVNPNNPGYIVFYSYAVTDCVRKSLFDDTR